MARLLTVPKLDLDYHERSRKVAEVMGVQIYGSGFNQGFAYTTDGGTVDVPHKAVETIEALVAKAKELEDALAWKLVPETPEPSSLVVYYTPGEYGIIDGADWDNRDLMAESDEPVTHWFPLPPVNGGS